MSELFGPISSPAGAVHIDRRYSVLHQDDFWLVLCEGVPVADFHDGDVAGRGVVMVQLCVHGSLTEPAVAKAFGVSRPTVARAKRKHAEGGVAALVPHRRGPKEPTKLKGATAQRMVAMARKGLSKTEVARRLGVNESAVRKALQRMGLEELAVRQPPLVGRQESEQDGGVAPGAVEQGEDAEPQGQLEPARQPKPTAEDTDTTAAEQPSADSSRDEQPRGEPEPTQQPRPTAENTAEAEQPSADASAIEQSDAASQDASTPTSRPVPAKLQLVEQQSLDADASERGLDRLFARMGQLDDAAPVFDEQPRRSSRAGLLLALPVLLAHGVFADATRIFGSIGPAFYGLRNSILSLLLLFLARINRPEGLKEHSPWELGAVMGLDRFPEMKTLRRKLRQLATQSRSARFMEAQMARALSRLRASQVWLYLDGHVSVYSGKRKLGKQHVTRLRTSLPAVLDYWLNDENGDPLMVVTGAPRKSMVKLVPTLVEQVRATGEHRPITIVFDREGWSPRMFAELDAMDEVYFLTYRKAQPRKKLPKLPASAFMHHEGVVKGCRVKYELADNGIYVYHGSGKKRRRLRLRQVTRLTADTGHQTHVVTNNWELETLLVAHGMFSRWAQENSFKYMGQELQFDGLLTYLMQDADGERMVANPKRRKLKSQVDQLQRKHDKLVAEYGQRALDNEERQRRTMRGFKIANGELGRAARQVEEELVDLRLQHEAMPARVPVKETLKDGQQPKQVHVETRRLAHSLRMATIRAESALRELMRPHYSRWRQDGRTIIQSMMQSAGQIQAVGDHLQITLDAQSAPHRTRALDALCGELNVLDAKFPGSHLRMRFAVSEHPGVS